MYPTFLFSLSSQEKIENEVKQILRTKKVILLQVIKLFCAMYECSILTLYTPSSIKEEIILAIVTFDAKTF